MSKRDERWAEHRQELEAAAKAAGIDVDTMVKIAGFESGFNPDAKPISTSKPELNTVTQYDGTKAISSAHGFGQFLNGTWHDMIQRYGEKYGVENAANLTPEQANTPALREDTRLQASMLAEFTRENIERAAQYGGKDVDANVYAMHNLGSGDAATFLTALRDKPEGRVDSVLSAKVIAGNPALYGDGSMSVQDAYARMGEHMDRYQHYADEATRGLPSGTLTPSAPSRTPADAMADGMLSPNERGPQVEQLQQQLAALGYTGLNGQPLVPDGAYGDNTKHAVERFQQDRGLEVDGVAGRNTLQALQGQEPQQTQQQSPQQTQDAAARQVEQPAQAQGTTQQAAQPTAQTADSAMQGAAAGVTLNRAYDLSQQFDHVKYGFGDKTPENGTVDCSGWVVRLANESMQEINEQAGRTVFPASERYSPGYDHAAKIVEKTVERSGVRLEGEQITPQTLREGMIIGEDNGNQGWDRGRFEGIDHITMVVRDPTDGQLKVSQSRSREGVELSSLETYLERKEANGVKLIATDPLAPARDMIRENGEVRGALPRQAATATTQGERSSTHSTLRDDSRGSEVKALQESLNQLGYTDRAGQKLEPDAKFGPRTEEAVKAFQRAQGLQDDGIVGPKTHAALDKAREQTRTEDAPTQQKAAETPQKAAETKGGGGISDIFDAAKQGDRNAFQEAMARLAESSVGRAFAEARDNAQQAFARESQQQQQQQTQNSTMER